MKRLIIPLPGNEVLAASLAQCLNVTLGESYFHAFPDDEVCVRLGTDVDGLDVVVVASLNRPNEKFLPLYYLADHLHASGALSVTLVAPYLAYMRQDKQFHSGEAVTSRQFARLLSGIVDRLVTVDPHLHRYASLNDIYTIPTSVIHASAMISAWIKSNVSMPVIIGPDSESKQWVAAVAHDADAPYCILKKERLNDDDVRIHLPDLQAYGPAYTPVLVDDIISTAHTMMEAVRLLGSTGMQQPICVGVHAVFTDDAYNNLMRAGVAKIVTTNTINHATNGIDMTDAICAVLHDEHDAHDEHDVRT